ncbi:MAG: chemotaxis protein CheW [Campylobacterota bacterium]|nr:chemotaxis protein CheW [Campylobacterota bacterium]
MSIEEILIIKNGNESYGISTDDINQIARVPMLMPLPLRPFGVRGLCAVSGNIVTMVDMNLLVDKNQVEYDNNKTRLISLNGSLSSSALLVSEVYNTIEIDDKKIDYIDKEDDPVIAIYKYKNALIQIISLEVLFSKINRVEIESKEIKNGKTKVEILKEEDSSRFLIFAMENEKYALNIEYLREIILSDFAYTEIAGSSDEVLGLITLRDELIIVIDLRKHYGFNSTKGYKNRILITSHDGRKIGLLVDEILDIKNYPLKDIEYMHDTFEENKIAGVIHAKDSLVSFFDEGVLENLFKANEAFIDDESNLSDSEDLNEVIMEVIVFKLASKEYSFDVDNVAEIIDVVDSTKVAYTNNCIDGIINIRGQIVTIVSLFKKLNIPTKINEDSKIIVCNINNVKIGFIVDSVSDILNVKENEIREQDDELFTKILHLDNGKRLVLSMDIDKIISN